MLPGAGENPALWGGRTATPSFHFSLTTGKRGSLMSDDGRGPPCPHPQSPTRPFRGLAWDDKPVTGQTNSLKAIFWRHLLRDPPDPGEENPSGTFLLQSLTGGTNHQGEQPERTQASSSSTARGERPPCDAAHLEVLARRSREFKAPKGKKALCFLQSLLRLKQSNIYSFFPLQAQNLYPDPLSQNAQTAVFVLKSVRPDGGLVAHNRCLVATASLGEGEPCELPALPPHDRNPTLEKKPRLSPPSQSALQAGLHQRPPPTLHTPPLQAVGGTPPHTGRECGQGRGRKPILSAVAQEPRGSSGRPPGTGGLSSQVQEPKRCRLAGWASRGAEGSGTRVSLVPLAL